MAACYITVHWQCFARRFCEYRLQKKRESQRKSWECMISVHREVNRNLVCPQKIKERGICICAEKYLWKRFPTEDFMN